MNIYYELSTFPILCKPLFFFNIYYFCYVYKYETGNSKPCVCGCPWNPKEGVEATRRELKPGHKSPSIHAMNCTWVIYKSTEYPYILILLPSLRGFVLKWKAI